MNMPAIFLVVLSVVALSGVVMACPASTVLHIADTNQGTALHDKASEVADKYMTQRGINPESYVGEITRPYVIGTTLVENNISQGYYGTNSPEGDRIFLDRDSVDEAVSKALGGYAGSTGIPNSDMNGHGLAPCWHHFNRHFGNGLHQAGNEAGPLNSQLFGG